ncbi:pilus assembly protein CpaB [Paucibacter oligotrophus]|uniref:Pilus assembly protein CpaB n=1 Tax=Roseateles oligotrophus TaxID=1769250 RepID=A0A840L920_9BURK|nr:Flp pilus assembly protein CpaB [Roseateles oligotrophus]MBB4842629.1 pilus assembly protein CpaB [Roseateles oligotrophus]
MKIPSIKSLKVNKTWLGLGAALGIGLIAALAARSYLSNQIEQINAKGKGERVAVVVAKGDLPKGALLSADNLAVREIPAEYAHSTALSPDQFERVEGQSLAMPLRAGEMVMWGLLEPQRPATFSARVEAGRRALTLAVDEISSISGMLEPGDAIDLIATLDLPGGKRTVPVMQGVKVLATGQRAVDDAKSGERRNYSTVTLDTDPQQAQILIQVRERGRITALLRNPGDQAVLPGIPRDLAAWLNGKGGDMGDGKTVPVLYGGGLTRLAPEALNLPGAATDAKAVQGADASQAAELARALSGSP